MAAPTPTNLVPLTQATLGSLPAHVQRSSYDRTKLKAGILHFGVGAFHRAHQALYLDRVIDQTKSYEWGICGVGVLPFDLPMRDAMKAQDCLYTVTEMSPDGKTNSIVIQSMIEYIYAPEDYGVVIKKLCDPDIKIVSLTITEGGYFMDNKGNFTMDHPHVVKDLAAPSAPQTAVGLMVEGLAQRRNAGQCGFTVMSCDNLRHNGDQAKKACMTFANARDPELAKWIDANVPFPNGMVDRITPATDSAVRQRLTHITHIDDKAPVICEDFIQWVLEDNFKYGRPAYELAGVTMTNDVMPYEEAKIRLLNGSHQMLSYPAFLAGERRVDIALQDPLFNGYIRAFLFEDSGPFIKDIEGMSMGAYKEKLISRFGNAAIGDQLARLCLDGGSKIPGFLLPTIKANLELKGTCHRLAYLLACYNHYLHTKTDDKGATFELREPNAMALLEPIIASNSPLTFLETTVLVGDAASYPQFVKDYLTCYEHVKKDGAYKTLQNLATILA
jgi:mannitol 2-dehydrogenase